ncbi:hypothetical protein AVEN_203860-1 [Araneus ventricosus]|uniref:Uncharacterized protein n=1 Tax=Araneus ventricosus TaxID=182803 RepID=A0A4Y2I9J2_ARAVE|nr:hypothetical protein AVEN_203860-1 [Araneus ventricosus]
MTVIKRQRMIDSINRVANEKDHLICASTLGIGPFTYESAVLLQDQDVLRKLSSANMVPLEIIPNFLVQNIDNETQNFNECQNAVLSISQLIRFNCVKSRRNPAGLVSRHQLHNETPLPLYLGLMIHNVAK